MKKRSYPRRWLSVYLALALTCLSALCAYAAHAHKAIAQRELSSSDEPAAQLQEAYALLYYIANDHVHSALLDPDAALPQVLTNDFFNQLDQRCAQLDSEGETRFYYRIRNAAGEVIATNQEADAANVVLRVSVAFDAQGNAQFTVNGRPSTADGWAIPSGIDSVRSLYVYCFNEAQLGRYGTQDRSLQQLRDTFIEALRRPLPANLTYELTFTNNSSYVTAVYDEWTMQLRSMLSLWNAGIFLLLAILGTVLVVYAPFEQLEKSILAKGRRMPAALIALLCVFSLRLYAESGMDMAGVGHFLKTAVTFVVAGMCSLSCGLRLLFIVRSYREVPYRTYLSEHFLIFTLFQGKLGAVRTLLPRAILYLFAVWLWCLGMRSQGWIGITMLRLCQLWAVYVAVGGVSTLYLEYREALQSLGQMEGPHRKQESLHLTLLKGLDAALVRSKERFAQALGEELRSQRMKNELITNVSHDLKTPLTSVRGYVDLLRQQPGTPQQQTYLEKLDGSVARLTALVEDLFDVSRADSGNLQLCPEKVALGELVRQVVFEHARALKERGLAIRMEGFAPDVMIYVDPEKTYRIFDNLIRNCVKYAMSDTRVYIVLTVEEQASVCIKNISEHEIGFDAREILERFVRGDASRTTEGSGLGLAIVRSFACAQQGSFHVEIDGDLFKAFVKLPLAGEEQKQQGGEAL